MFGDPVENEKGWEMIPLSELGTCKNGMNFASDEDGIEIAYLGVGDFKDNSRIDGVSGLSQISLNTMPSEEYLLKDEDIVFVRSNGSNSNWSDVAWQFILVMKSLHLVASALGGERILIR